ncbi:MAG: chromosome replication initiation protein, partial [Gemmataceae bacterium]|nr:chromosome replication initiation protein [Gemmataceae bacterium]
MTTSEREVVAALEAEISRRIGEPRYNLWFVNKTKFGWEGDRLVVRVPNPFHQQWLQTTFADDVCAAAREVIGRPVQVRFAIDAEPPAAACRDDAAPSAAAEPPRGREPLAPPGSAGGPPAGQPVPAPEATPQQSAARLSKTRARRWHQLRDFTVGSCNRVAYASALSVIEEPGQAANPLVLHGPVGTGKTHLLEGVYAGLRKAHADWRVVFVTAEDF